MGDDIVFYISETREYAECYRYALDKGFLAKYKHDWFMGGDILERKIEEDRGQYHKYFDSFKYIEINYIYSKSKRELSSGFGSKPSTSIHGVKEFKIIVDFLERYGTHLINDIKKTALYYFKESTDKALKKHFGELEKV